MTGRGRSKRISCLNKDAKDEHKFARPKGKEGRGGCFRKKGRHI